MKKPQGSETNKQNVESLRQWKEKCVHGYQRSKKWLFLHLRRWGYVLQSASGGTTAVGPISFLIVSAALAVAMTLTTLYSISYSVTVDGSPVGVFASEEVLQNAIRSVENKGSELLGRAYQVESQIDCHFTLSLKDEVQGQKELESYFYSQLDEISATLRNYQVNVNGRAIGAVKDKNALQQMLEGMKQQYVTKETVSSEFIETVEVKPIYVAEEVLTVAEMKTKLEQNTTGDTTYAVRKGDTFNGIAYANDMSISDLKALNPGINIDRLSIGEILNVKETIPTLSVKTVERISYTESIPCPVETVEDDSIYRGDSKILTQGKEGEAQVEAAVTYVNGAEKEREVVSTTTLREPTKTVKAVGTKERPKTASYGSYIWPISGRITSYFGGRHIFGSYSYHSGIDIAASYGANIVASDGGTVTFSGWKGTYGNLVIITHDNGTKTYYGHNSSLLVSTGQKVYRGQPIAKAGSTGRSTGVHCHFEVRVNGSAVNPLNFLK